MEYLRQHLVMPDILGESIWQWKWALYALSLFLSLLIPAIGPANCAVQRFFDESQKPSAPIPVVDTIYVLWIIAFSSFGCMSIKYTPHPPILRLLQYLVACTIPQYLFGPLALWRGIARHDSEHDYFHLWLAPSFTMGVLVARVIEYMIPVRVKDVLIPGKSETGKDLSKSENGSETIDYPSTWMIWLSGQSRR